MGFVVLRGEFRSLWSATRTRRLAIGAVIVALLCALIVRYDWDSARYIVYAYGIEGGRGTSSTWWIGSGLRVSTVGVVVALAASLLLMISTIRA